MNIKAEELEQHGLELKWRVSFCDLLPFIKEGLQDNNFYALFYYWINILLILSLIITCIVLVTLGWMGLGAYLLHVGTGVIMSFFLIPIHELIHGIAYKLLGAPQVKYGVILQKFMFYAIAHRFVTCRRDFTIAATAPFFIISLGILGTMFFVNLSVQVILLGILFMHTACCSGDFGLCGYFAKYKHYHLVLFDDAKERVSYFYGLRPSW